MAAVLGVSTNGDSLIKWNIDVLAYYAKGTEKWIVGINGYFLNLICKGERVTNAMIRIKLQTCSWMSAIHLASRCGADPTNDKIGLRGILYL